MGLYLNPGNETFAELVQADIYVDKTGLIAYMNGCIGKAKTFDCVQQTEKIRENIGCSNANFILQ